MLNLSQVVDVTTSLTLEQGQVILDFIKESGLDWQYGTPDQEYDQRVQAVLDEYWPGTSDLKNIKRITGKAVYLAEYEGSDVIVKSVTYDDTLLKADIHDMGFVDFIGEAVEASTYIEPGVQVSDDKELILTMT
jgi:hypothetical protein